MRLKNVITISGKIYCITGLCIGGSSNALEIGGISQEVIKNPLTKEPYIPGSSLKGKMRSELEKKYGSKKQVGKDKFITDEVNPCGCGKRNCLICTIFGVHNNKWAKSGPTRIIVRDAMFTEEFRSVIKNLPIAYGSYLERKVENIIQRDTGKANSPRTIERIPEGASFNFEIILRVFEGDDAKAMLECVEEGLRLVELSYLGGNGSRGSGQVKFEYECKYDTDIDSVSEEKK